MHKHTVVGVQVKGNPTQPASWVYLRAVRYAKQPGPKTDVVCPLTRHLSRKFTEAEGEMVAATDGGKGRTGIVI